MRVGGKRLQVWRGFMSSMALGASAVAQAAGVADAISTDPVADAAHPAAMLELAIESHGDALYGVFYRAAGASPHPTVLLLHGFAGFEQNEDLAQALRRAGWNVLIFHYRGAWGSAGAFSFTHCVEDVAAVLAYLRAGANADRLGVDPRRLVLVGHSVGGHLAGIVAARDPEVLGVAMISAANRHVAMSRPGWYRETLARFRLEMGPLRGSTAPQLVGELKAHAAQWDLVTLAPQWQPRPVLIVSSDDIFRDESAAIVQVARRTDPAHLTEAHLPGDHAYSGERIALQRTLLAWLARFGPPADPR